MTGAQQGRAGKETPVSGVWQRRTFAAGSRCLGFAALAVLISARPAWAYMDPGSGTALLYVIISVLSTLYFLARGFFYRFRGAGKPPAVHVGGKQGIILLSEGKNYQYTFRPVVEALLAHETPFRYLTMDLDDPLLELEHPLMDVRYIGDGLGAHFKIASIRGEVMLSTTPHIGVSGYPLPRPRRVECLAHVFHAIGAGQYYRKHALDHYQAVLLPGSPFEPLLRKLEEARGLAPRECPGVGLPYLDILSRRLREWPADNKKPGGPPVVLLAPTWGSTGSLALCAEIVVPRLLDAGYRVILRPHPQAYRSEADLVNDVAGRFENDPRVRFDREIDATPSMVESSLLISDTSGVRFDYAFIHGKPVITIDRPVPTGEFELDCIGLDNPWEQQSAKRIGRVIPVAKLEHIVPVVEGALTLTPKEVFEFRDHWLANFGKAGEAVTHWLITREQNDGGPNCGESLKNAMPATNNAMI